MKKIFLASCLTISIALSSCSNFLDVEPTNAVEAEDAVKTVNDAKVLINGLMRKISSSSYYGRNFMLYGDVKGGDFTILSQGRGMDYLYVFNHSESSNSFSSVWTQGFDALAQINNLLANIEKLKAEGSTDNFDSYIGQALTTRALINFDLVRLYGKSYNENKDALGVPNVTKLLDYTAQELRTTVAENYKQILMDLKAAEALLPKAKSNGYLNYYGNKALQARVYLNMEDYPNALTAAKEVIDANVYKLYTNEEWTKSWQSEFGAESIFEIGIYPNEGDGGNSSLGAYFRRAKHGGNAILGNFMASDQFLEAMAEDSTDIRYGILSNDEINANRFGAVYKYSGGTALEGDKNSSNSTAVNIKVFRLSEIYLIAAEAALLQASANKELAATYLNAIRQRSPKLDPATAASIDLDLIANERRKELVGEGQRFFDMMRWNKSITFNDEIGNIITIHRPKTIDRSFNKTILPISLDEINANPGLKAQQNPGY